MININNRYYVTTIEEESNIEMWQNYAKKGETRSSQGSRTRMRMLKDKGFKKFTGSMAASSLLVQLDQETNN